MLDKSTFFVSRKTRFSEAEELTVVYGSSYKRTYSTWGHAGVPVCYHVPCDTYDEGTWERWAKWPTAPPGWYNVDRQPTNRPAFERTEGASARVLPDLPSVITARRLGLDGGAHEQRLAKIPSLNWDHRLPSLSTLACDSGDNGCAEFVPPATSRFAAGLTVGLVGLASRREFDAPALLPTTSHRLAFPQLPDPSDALTPALPVTAAGAAAAPALAFARKGGVLGVRVIDSFDLPHTLRGANRAELQRLAKAEELAARGRREPEGEADLTELQWNSPWRSPIGSVVWCRMQGFNYWPAEASVARPSPLSC